MKTIEAEPQEPGAWTSSHEDIALEQLRQFRKLSFKEKILCLEGMAEVVRRVKGKAGR